MTFKQRDALDMSTMKTVYNVRHQYRVLQKAGRSQMQQLLSELAKHKCIECHQCEKSTMIVTDLFWAHPMSLDLLRTFPHVLIMNCTYKTNRYHLPLLKIVGVTSTHMTFSVVSTYLQIEPVDNYAWVLQILRDLMDNNILPKVIITDRELALMNAIDNAFPNARHLLFLYHLSLQQCLTFLPLRSPPITPSDHHEITIGFVNGNHFVQVFLEPGNPVPPIVVIWRVHQHPCASEWENAYVNRIQKFKDNI
ncbi:protein FAR1-RELATED SEQUENCE 5-like [Camellia sinensis]|uniref:protein FAR1-RELATED SEQUENCE 5-like n=1 Tax=Camellia sinensis TaxID=4442 RepID=UPI00103553FF|nr:protein FAR1-RELATED SEQUENCE 5-like [Camellia sinensis]